MARRGMVVFPALLLALLAADVRGQEPGRGRRPNVLLIIADDLRAELGCYGGRARTPNLDGLAHAGVRFERAYCQFPLCNPSRTSMLTGRDPAATRVLGNRDDFRKMHPDWVSLPQMFRENGYVSVRAGKIFHGAGLDDPKAWSDDGDARRGGGGDEDEEAEDANAGARGGGRPAGTPRPVGAATAPAARGQMTRAQYSDRWYVLEGDGESHGDYKTADRTIENLRRHKDKPFFIACGFVKPHSPLAAPQRFYDLFPLEKIELPPDFAERPTVPPGFPAGAIRRRNADLFIGRDATPQAAKEMIRAYLASASWTDFNVGRVLAELDRLGLRENTVVVFWGDHGFQLGEKGKWSKAGSLWEQGTRTPLIVAAPGVAGNGKASGRVVQALDVYRTLAELCGLTVQEGVEGRSLVPLLNDPAAVWDHPAFTIWSEDGRWPTGIAVRTERWRYAEFGPGGTGEGAMLLDGENDPHEMTNLAEDPRYAGVRAELAGRVRAYAGRYAKAAP